MLLGTFTCSITAPAPLSPSLFPTHSQFSSGVDVQETKIQSEQSGGRLIQSRTRGVLQALMCGKPQLGTPLQPCLLGGLWAGWDHSGELISLTNESAPPCSQALIALQTARVQPAPCSRCLQSSLSCWGLCLGTKCSGLTQPLSHTDTL